jgi:hypothetical protein
MMGREMRKKLMNLDMYEETRNLSRVIMKILTFLIPVIEKEHKWGEQRMSRYMYVSDNPEEKRDHVHSYLPEAMYRRLKLMHQDLNFYSIAQIVREFLEFFLELVQEHGNDVFQVLNRVFTRWNEEKGKNRLTSRKLLRQLNIILRHLSDQNEFINVYDNKFTPFWIFQL